MQRWGLVFLTLVTIIMVAAAAQQVWRVLQRPPTPQGRVEPTAITSVPPSPTTQPTIPITPTMVTMVATPTVVLPSPTVVPPTPSPFPTPQGYIAYRVKEGETLTQIAQAAGSTVAFIQAFNRFGGDPAPQRPLIIPQIDAQQSTLASQAIIVQRGANRPAVALTFDAGASSKPTESMLDTLAARRIRVTFFLTGAWIRNNPELTRRIVADGHEIANHSTSHPDFTTIDDAQMQQELNDMAHALVEITGTLPAPFFRPPFGAYNENVLRTVIKTGYLPIFWTLDSLDSVGDPKTPAFLLDRLTNTLSVEKINGAILLVHCGSQATADALPDILDEFARRGIIVTTLSQVL
ncbi:MAG: polysaccharide deacetylase family protein [Roseiflexaceae bacterium]